MCILKHHTAFTQEFQYETFSSVLIQKGGKSKHFLVCFLLPYFSVYCAHLFIIHTPILDYTLEKKKRSRKHKKQLNAKLVFTQTSEKSSCFGYT